MLKYKYKYAVLTYCTMNKNERYVNVNFKWKKDVKSGSSN